MSLPTKSWAEQYEEKKAARLAEEKRSRQNVSRGFSVRSSSSLSSSEEERKSENTSREFSSRPSSYGETGIKYLGDNEPESGIKEEKMGCHQNMLNGGTKESCGVDSGQGLKGCGVEIKKEEEDRVSDPSNEDNDIMEKMGCHQNMSNEGTEERDTDSCQGLKGRGVEMNKEEEDRVSDPSNEDNDIMGSSYDGDSKKDSGGGGDISNGEKTVSSPSGKGGCIGKEKNEKEKSDSSDPWLNDYEARKAAAIENLKTGQLQSVCGSSGYVDHSSSPVGLPSRQVSKLMKKLKREEPSVLEKSAKSGGGGGTGVNNKTKNQPISPNKLTTSVTPPRHPRGELKTLEAFSKKPPPTPGQLLGQQNSSSEEASPSSPSYSPRPNRPSVPTPSKYGTQYGGAPSPGPRPSRNFQPPGYVPPTPPSARSRNPMIADEFANGLNRGGVGSNFHPRGGGGWSRSSYASSGFAGSSGPQSNERGGCSSSQSSDSYSGSSFQSSGTGSRFQTSGSRGRGGGSRFQVLPLRSSSPMSPVERDSSSSQWSGNGNRPGSNFQSSESNHRGGRGNRSISDGLQSSGRGSGGVSSLLTSMQAAKADSSLSSSNWQEEYLARKKARLDS